MKKNIAKILCFLSFFAFSDLGMAQVGQPAMPGQRAASGASSIPITIVDQKGQAVPPESLPKEAQAQLARVRRAAESLRAAPAGGGTEKLNITIRCTWPPLRCTIEVAF